MTKKEAVLGIVGSPRRKGNTHVLVERILEGAAQAGAATEIAFLDRMRIVECDGCHRCWKGGKCAKEDDMSAFYPKIIESSAIVFGTPVYWYGPTALMKSLIDRFVYFNCPENRAGVRHKRAAIAIPFEEDDPEVAEPLIKFFDRSLAYLEMRTIGRLMVPGVTLRGEVRKKDNILSEAFELGKRLAQPG
jgi:multimeric flavodoxin WrbA